eukprot:907348-Pyramimonas_sp.AAC.1
MIVVCTSAISWVVHQCVAAFGHSIDYVLPVSDCVISSITFGNVGQCPSRHRWDWGIHGSPFWMNVFFRYPPGCRRPRL